MDKIFCIGFPKTGTTSLEEALSLLGYNVCRGHYNNRHTNYLISLFYNKNFDEIDRIISYYDAFTDLPWGGTDFYIYLSNKYPKAKFIHSERNHEEWYGSLEKMLTKFDKNLETALASFHKEGRYGAVQYIEKEFQITTLSNNKEAIIKHYIESNIQVNNYFQNEKFSFLNIKLVEGEGWEKLCPFLNKAIPSIRFPHANKADVKQTNENSLSKVLPSFMQKLLKR